MTLLAALSVAVASCVQLPPTVEPHPRRIHWDHEPTVGTEDPTLHQDVSNAIAAWGWGIPVMGCGDICVSRGFLFAGAPAGRSVWEPGEQWCQVAVYRPSPIVVSHELGHCYGLGHSVDRRSVMYPEVLEQSREDWPWQYVTRADRAALHEVIP